MPDCILSPRSLFQKLFLVFSLFLLWVTPVLAQSETIKSFHSAIEIRSDGYLHIRETIVVNVLSKNIKHGIYRDFPLTYADTPDGVYFSVYSVTLDGNPLSTSDIQRSKNSIRIYMRDKNKLLSPGEHTFELEYMTGPHVVSFKDYDELYWNVTGVWSFPIEHASCKITIPEQGTIGQTFGWAGPKGSKNSSPEIVREYNNSVLFENSGRLKPGEQFTVALNFPKDLVSYIISAQNLSFNEQFSHFLNSFPISQFYLALLIGLTYYFGTWWYVGRDPKPGTIIPLYYPPTETVSEGRKKQSRKAMSAAAISFIKNKLVLSNEAFSSLFLELSFLRLCEIKKTTVKGFILSSEVFEVQMSSSLSPEEADEALKKLSSEAGFLYDLLKKNIGSRGSLQISEKNKTTINALHSAIESHLKLNYGKLWFKNTFLLFTGILTIFPLTIYIYQPNAFSFRYFITFISLFLLFNTIINLDFFHFSEKIKSAATFILFFATQLLIGISKPIIKPITDIITNDLANFFLHPSFNNSIFLAILPIIYAYLIAAPTRSGRALLDQIEGFEQYIKIAERNRLAQLNLPQDTPKVFERVLPYAMALKLGNEWCQRFSNEIAQGMMTQSGLAFHSSSDFSSFMSSFSSATASASGSSGGGSSGRGRGGGGGGGC